jgi:hypothetical protein
MFFLKNKSFPRYKISSGMDKPRIPPEAACRYALLMRTRPDQFRRFG